jgi:hypothetical protein
VHAGRMRTRGLLLVALLVVIGAVVAAPASGGDHDRPRERRVVARVVGGAVGSVGPSPSLRSSLSDPREPRLDAKFASLSRPSVRPGRHPAAPAIVAGFDGIGDIDGRTPADPTGALGNTLFFTAINVSWALFDRTGVPVLGPEPLESIDRSLGTGILFDPKVIYDQYDDTFVLVFLQFDVFPRLSRIIVTAIPDATATDTTTWCTTILKGDQLRGDGVQWADYPGLGYTVDRVTVTTNQFGFGRDLPFRYAQILSFDKADLYDCTDGSVAVDVVTGRRTRNLDGSPAFTLQPAQTVGVLGTDQYLLSFELRGRRSFHTIWRVRPAAAGVQVMKARISTGAVKPPLLALQAGARDPFEPDFFWDAGDGRLVNAFYDADRNLLYAAHTVRKDFKPDIGFDGYIEAAARWYEIAPADALDGSSIARRGVIGEPDVEIGWPVVATDELGNLFVTYNRASFTFDEFLSAWIASIPPGATEPSEQALVAGDDLYDVRQGPERWGDFNAIGRDPTLGSVVFAINQYATTNNVFQQSVHTVREV